MRLKPKLLLTFGFVAGLLGTGCSPTENQMASPLPLSVDLAEVPASVSQAITRAQQQIDPGQPLPALVASLGRVLHANGLYAEARQCWIWLESQQPATAEWVYLLSDLDQIANHREDRVSRLAKVTELDPTYATAWLRRAELVLKSGFTIEAALFYEKRLALLPSDSYARMGLARIDLAANEVDQALVRLEAILREDPNFSPAHNLYAELMAERGDEATARQHRWIGRETGRYREPSDPWLEAVAAACADPARLELTAQVAAQVGDAPRARQLMEQAFAAGEEAPWYRESLGKLYHDQGDLTKARAVLGGGVDESRTLGSWVALIQIERTANAWAETFSHLDRALSLHPGAFELWNELGQALTAVGQTDKALGAYQKALELDPFDADTNFNLAATLIGRERFVEAVTGLQQSLRSQPSYPPSLKLLSRLELDSGRPADAAPYVQRLYASHPGDPDACDLMADWHLAYGRRAEAQRVMDEGLILAQWAENSSTQQYFQQRRQELD